MHTSHNYQSLLTQILGAIALGGLAVGMLSCNDDQTSLHGVSCDMGQPGEFCLSHSAMLHQAKFGYGQVVPDSSIRSNEEANAGFDENGCMRSDWVASSCCNRAQSAGEPQGNGSCCYIACEGICCGRPFVVNGIVHTAELTVGEDWLSPQHTIAPAQPIHKHHSGIAQAWARDALMEHASIASFARFTLDLMALGAPPELLLQAQQAAADEVRHAEICFSIARRLGAELCSPGPLACESFEPRSLAEAIEAAVVEGCIGETLAGALAAERAARCTDQALSHTLQEIAEDELRHAELAWRFVSWTISAFGETAARSAEHAFNSALNTCIEPSSSCAESTPTVLHSAGLLSAQEQRDTVRRIHASVLRPAARCLMLSASRVSSANAEPKATTTGLGNARSA